MGDPGASSSLWSLQAKHEVNSFRKEAKVTSVVTKGALLSSNAAFFFSLPSLQPLLNCFSYFLPMYSTEPGSVKAADFFLRKKTVDNVREA